MADLPEQVPVNKIRLYCVGIYFYRDLDFKPDQGKLMTGVKVLEEAAKEGLRYRLSQPPAGPAPGGHIQFVSYSPKPGDPMRHPPSGLPTTQFPYFGMPLSLTEVMRPIGELSQILQYSCDGPPAHIDLIKSPQFGANGFLGGSFLRVRLISIYDATPPQVVKQRIS